VTEPVRVTAGRHTVEVRLEGYRTETQVVEVVGGADARVSLRLARQEAVATTTPVTPVTEPTTTPTAEPDPVVTEPVATTTTTTTTLADPAPSSGGGGIRIGIPTIITASVTVAALITALVTGPLALSANDAFERDVADANDPGILPEGQEQARIDGRAHASQAQTLATVTDVMIVTTIVAAGVTTTLFILDQTSGEGDAEQVAIIPVFTPQAVAITASGRF
jgi:hypothetical protein